MAVFGGKGTLLSMGATPVAQRVSIDGPDRKVTFSDKTHLDSEVREKRPTIGDNGSISGKLLYDPTQHASLEALIEAPVTKSWSLTFPTGPDPATPLVGGTVFTFDGFLTGFKNTGIEVEGNLEADYSIEITGKIAVTVAAGGGT